MKTKQDIMDLKQTQSDLSYRLLTILREYICRILPQNDPQHQQHQHQHQQQGQLPHQSQSQISQIFGRSGSIRTSLSPINMNSSSSINSHIHTNEHGNRNRNRIIDNPLTDNELKLKRTFESILQEIRSINHHFAQIDESLENIDTDLSNNGLTGRRGRGTGNRSVVKYINGGRFNDNGIVANNSEILNSSLMNQNILTNSRNDINFGDVNNQVLSQNTMKGMFDFLKKQQTFLANLKRTVQDDWDDLQIISQGLMKHSN